jgi:hypothetical protein
MSPSDHPRSLIPFPAAGDDGIARPDRSTLEAHLARRRYGRFTLTDAVRPAWNLGIAPCAGYRHDSYTDPRSGGRLPAIIASVSSESLFDTFLRLLEPLGDVCDVVLESSHDQKSGHTEALREGVERVILESVLCDFEDLILDDGCTGVAIMHPHLPQEVQLDEHKLLIIYAADLEPFEDILAAEGIPRRDGMRFISQGDHLHTSHTGFDGRFTDFCHRLQAE